MCGLKRIKRVAGTVNSPSPDPNQDGVPFPGIYGPQSPFPPPHTHTRGLCLVFGLQDGGLVGMRAKKVCVPKIGLSVLALCSKFHFSAEANSSRSRWWVGGWVVWPGGGVRQIPPPRLPRPDPYAHPLRRFRIFTGCAGLLGEWGAGGPSTPFRKATQGHDVVPAAECLVDDSRGGMRWCSLWLGYCESVCLAFCRHCSLYTSCRLCGRAGVEHCGLDMNGIVALGHTHSHGF